MAPSAQSRAPALLALPTAPAPPALIPTPLRWAQLICDYTRAALGSLESACLRFIVKGNQIFMKTHMNISARAPPLTPAE